MDTGFENVHVCFIIMMMMMSSCECVDDVQQLALRCGGASILDDFPIGTQRRRS